ncbi:MAG: LVIVD repeat-containing protein [Gemmatimonadaceae bacterium]
MKSGLLICASLSLVAVGCTPSSAGIAPAPAVDMSTSPPSPDPRLNLRAGWFDAGEASWNLRLVSHTKPSANFLNPTTPGDPRLWNSDIAMTGPYVFQGNWSGYQVWDISNPAKVTLRSEYVCPGSQSDVTVYRNLLFVSSEATNARVDCGMQGVTDTVSKERARGIRIFDIADIGHPKLLTTVQTCRGSHTNTLVTDPNDNANVYIYVSGRAGIRSPNELAGCSSALPEQDPNSSQFRIEVIQVPVAHPEQAKIVSSPRIFQNLTAPAKHAELVADSIAAAAARKRFNDSLVAAGKPRPEAPPRQPPGGPTQCHDITAYPAIGLAGGACAGYGLLLDIKNPANPIRIAAAADSNMSFWHSATFNNDGSKILFSDEWGGGTQPRCRSTDKPEWGADAIFTLVNGVMTFKSYYKLPVAQKSVENCVAHNGTLIPIPGRDIMTQAWYQGGVSVFDWTDPAHPKEIAYFDRGPMDSTKMITGGYWSTYWYNGYIIGSEIDRGLDIFELRPSAFISQNEIDAAKLVHFDYLNAQDQPKIVWPPSFVVARAYLDQLARGNSVSRERVTAIANELSRDEKLSGTARHDALMQLTSQLQTEARASNDPARVTMLAEELEEIASH